MWPLIALLGLVVVASSKQKRPAPRQPAPTRPAPWQPMPGMSLEEMQAMLAMGWTLEDLQRMAQGITSPGQDTGVLAFDAPTPTFQAVRWWVYYIDFPAGAPLPMDVVPDPAEPYDIPALIKAQGTGLSGVLMRQGVDAFGVPIPGLDVQVGPAFGGLPAPFPGPVFPGGVPF